MPDDTHRPSMPGDERCNKYPGPGRLEPRLQRAVGPGAVPGEHAVPGPTIRAVILT